MMMKQLFITFLLLAFPSGALAFCPNGVMHNGSCVIPPNPTTLNNPIYCGVNSPNVFPEGSPQAALYDSVEKDYHNKRESIAVNQTLYNSCKNRIYQKFMPGIAVYPDEVVISTTAAYPFPERCTDEAWRYQMAANSLAAYTEWKLGLCLQTLSFFE